MRYLIFFTLLATVAAKPMPGYLSELDGGSHGIDYAPSYSVEHAAPVIEAAQIVHAEPVVEAAHVVHAAPVVHAPIAVAKAQATSYSSFQRVIHPVQHQIVHAAPVVQAAKIIHAAPVIHSAPVLSLESHGSYGHSYGHGW